MRMQAIFALVIVASTLTSTEGSEVTPVQKVVELMNGMLSKGKAEKQAEQVQFAEYKQFCENVAAEKQKAIATANEQMDVLKADIDRYIAHAAQMGRQIVQHDDDISVWTGDTKAATKVRQIEKSDYDATHRDYSQSVEAITGAIAVLKKQSHDRSQQTSFAQVSSLTSMSLIPADAKKVITAFLQQDPDVGLEVSAPEAHGYDFQSHGIIEMLEKLQDKFIGERKALEEEESNTKHAYEMMKQDLTTQISQATKDRDERSALKSKKLQAKADSLGDLEDTTTTRDADTKYLNDLVASCEQKAGDFETRQSLRSDEIEAVEKAIAIISGEAVTGNVAKHLPGFAQYFSATSFAFLRSETASESANQDHAARFLREQARRLQSRVLSALAARVLSDPFQKVKKMIKDLIVRLMEEANDEATQKGWCDGELSTNEQTRKDKTESVETLHAEIDQLEASLTKLTEDITELTQQVAALDSAMAEATKLRQGEKAKNTETIADAQSASTAVAQALIVLKEFYEKASESTAFVQQQPEAPEIFDKPYQGMQAENGGVVGMLEVIEADFVRLEADTKKSEASAQDEFETFMSDSKTDKSSKSTDIELKSTKKQDESQTLTVKKSDLEGTQKELDAALSYFDKLKPTCVDAGVTYEDRVARRKEEIESLQDALRILNGEND